MAQHRRAAPIVTLVAMVLSFVMLDAAIRVFSPPTPMREVADGLRDLENMDPETLVIGSSHARTFHVLGQELLRQAPGRPPLVAIPLEAGKLTGYAWLMDHRVLPLLEARGPDGRPVRQNIKRLFVLTEWWDSCAPEGEGLMWNLPARAWTLTDYLDDVSRNGFSEFNRNYLRARFAEAFGWSVAVQRRGTARILKDASRFVAGRESTHTPESYAVLLSKWRNMTEGGKDCLGDPRQMAALDQVLEAAMHRGLETYIVLFPRKPDTMTERAKILTIEPFRRITEELAARHHATLLDMTTSTPLASEDFMDDFDHVSPAGNLKFARWALEHDLAFLKAAPSGAPLARRGAETAR